MRGMRRLSIIGLGSSIADDQAGWIVVETLLASRRIAAYGERVAITVCRSPAGELLSYVADADIAIIVDAVRFDGAAGTVYRLQDIHNHSLSTANLVSSHGVDLPTMLSLAATLGCSPGLIVIYGIEAGPGSGADMSDNVCRAVMRVVDAILRDVENSFARNGNTLFRK